MTGPAKTLGFMPRRPDISRAAFRAYYEERHAPLAAPLFSFRRYRRSHLSDPSAEPGFDCVSEFWWTGEPMTGKLSETIRADERNFLDQPATRAARAEEVLRPAAPEGNLVLLLHRDGGDRQALIDACHKAGAGLDLLSPFDTRPLPYDALISLAGAAPVLPAGWRIGHRLEVDRCETDPATLQGG